MKHHKIGVLSCGSIAKRHASNLRGRADLVFWSRDRNKAKAYATKYGGQAADTDFDALLSDSSIKALILCSPPELHFEHCLKCIRAGKSVLVEKPLCISTEELNGIENELKNFSSVFMVAENYYYKPCFIRLRKLIQHSLMGEIRRIHLRKCFTQSANGWKSQYGSLIEGGIHFVAFMNGLVESAPLRMRADIPDEDKIERSSSLFVEYQNGVQARLEYAWNTPTLLKGLFQHSRIEGSHGEFIFESNGLYLMFRSYRSSVPAFIPFFRDIAGYQNMMNNFLKALDGEEEVYSNFQRAKRDLQLIFDAYALNSRDAIGQKLPGLKLQQF